MANKEDRINKLKAANELSHSITSKKIKEALYKMLEKKNINEIKVTDLIKQAGVSRGTFYKHYYYVSDILKEDLDELINNIVNNLTPSLFSNWLLVFNQVYEHREKLAFVYKAGLSLTLLKKVNEYFKDKENKDLYIIWNGIAFNAVYNWGVNGFRKSPERLAKEMTKTTKIFFENKITT